MSKNTAIRIESIESRIEQLQNERKRLMSLKKVTDRKARTKRLIERGAILESLFHNPTAITNDQFKIFLEKTITTDYAHKILREITTRKPETQSINQQMSMSPEYIPHKEKPAQIAQGTD